MVTKVLDNPALVLNRNWQPLNAATVSRALVLLWNDSARVVDLDDYRLPVRLLDGLPKKMPCECAGFARQRSKLQDEVQFPGDVLKDKTSLECAGFAYDPAKVEDQVQFPARTLL